MLPSGSFSTEANSESPPMPRILRKPEVRPRPKYDALTLELGEELRSNRESGQPWIEERQSPATDSRVVNVFWDKWEGVPEEDRIATILRAYEDVLGADYADTIAIPGGYTIPEGRDLGLLRYAILSGWRKTDPITEPTLREALIAEGASRLEDPNSPDLRFPTMDDAMAAIERLERRLPGSRDIWIVAEDVRQRTPQFDDE